MTVQSDGRHRSGAPAERRFGQERDCLAVAQDEAQALVGVRRVERNVRVAAARRAENRAGRGELRFEEEPDKSLPLAHRGCDPARSPRRRCVELGEAHRRRALDEGVAGRETRAVAASREPIVSDSKFAPIAAAADLPVGSRASYKPRERRAICGLSGPNYCIATIT